MRMRVCPVIRTPAKSALLMAKTIRTAPAPENLGDPRGPFIFIVLGLGVALAIVVLVVGIVSRKHSSGSMRMRMRDVRKAKGEEIFPKPNPDNQILGDELPKPSDASAGSEEPKFEDLGERGPDHPA